VNNLIRGNRLAKNYLQSGRFKGLVTSAGAIMERELATQQNEQELKNYTSTEGIQRL
jgi:hypothetical protein